MEISDSEDNLPRQDNIAVETNGNKVHHHTATKRREDAKIEDWNIDDHVASALYCINRNTRYLPAYPFQTLIHILRRKERLLDLPPRLAYIDIWPEGQSPQSIESFTLVRFKKTNGVALSHHLKILTPADVKLLEGTVAAVHESLGNLPTTTKKGDTEVFFVEAALTAGGMGNNPLLSPRPHVLDMVVEVIVYGPRLDDCLIVMIRRVFEEMDHAKKNKYVVCSDCRVLSKNGTLTSFSLADIRNRKQLVLTTMKSAIVEGGELSLELYLRVSRYLPVSLCSPQHRHLLSAEQSTSFIRVNRRYKFTFVDTSSVSTTEGTSVPPLHKAKAAGGDVLPDSKIRCFSQLPLDSLVRGVFFHMSDMRLYLSVCLQYSRALKARTREEAPVKIKNRKSKTKQNANDEDPLIRNVISSYCIQALKYLDNGEFAICGRWMMLIQAFITTDESATQPQPRKEKEESVSASRSTGEELSIPPSHCLKQLSALASNSSGIIQAMVDAADTLRSCVILMIVSCIERCPYFTSPDEADSCKKANPHWTNEAEICRQSVFFIYDSVGLSLIELRNLMLSLHRDVHFLRSSEAIYILKRVMTDIATLFNSKHVSHPLLPSSDVFIRRGSETGDWHSVQNDMFRALKSLDEPLNRISSFLRMLCTSVGGDALIELIQMDTDCRYRYKTPFSKAAMVGISYGTLKDLPNPTWKSLKHTPITLCELIGNGSEGIDSTGGWRPYRPRAVLRQLIEQNSESYGVNDKDEVPIYVLGLDAAAKREELVISEGALISTHQDSRTSILCRHLIERGTPPADLPDTIELLGALGLNFIGRLGAIDVKACLADEQLRRQEFPMCITLEVVRLRYMVESLAYSALTESYFDMFSAQEQVNPYVVICQRIYPYSTKLQLWNEVSDVNMIGKIYSGIRLPATLESHKPIQSTFFYSHRIPLSQLASNLKGGLAGPKPLVDILCTHWKLVYCNLWAIPPVLPGAPGSAGAGIIVGMYCGVSVETALHWGIPPETSVFAPKVIPKPPSKRDEPFKYLVSNRGVVEVLEDPITTAEDSDSDTDGNKIKKSHVAVSDDIWSLSFPGNIDFEVVMKVEHDVPSAVPIIRDLFAVEVEVSFLHMCKSSDWAVHQVRVPVSSTASPNSSKVFKFSANRLMTDESYAASFRKKAAKVGLAFIDAAALLVDTSGDRSGGSDGGMANPTGLLELLQDAVRGQIRGHVDSADVDITGEVDADPTATDIPRIAPGSAVGFKVSRALRKMVKIYTPVTLRFSLLGVIRGLDVPAAAAEKNSTSNTPLLSAEKKKLTIGRSETVARLLGSTLWASSEAEAAVWSCAMDRDSVRRCMEHESIRHAEESQESYIQGDVVGAYERLGAATIIGKGAGVTVNGETEDVWGDIVHTVPAMCRAKYSLAGKLKRTIDCIKMVRWMFSTNDGGAEALGSLNYNGLAHTIVRHVCLSLRMVIMAPQCIHLRGGCLLILRRLSELEAVLNLGRLPLQNGHRQKRQGKKTVASFSLPSSLPLPLLDEEYVKELKQMDISIDAESEFRRSISSQAVLVDGIPQRLLQDIEHMSLALYTTLCHDFHASVSDDIRCLVENPIPGQYSELDRVKNKSKNVLKTSAPVGSEDIEDITDGFVRERSRMKRGVDAVAIPKDDTERPGTSTSSLSNFSDVGVDSGRRHWQGSSSADCEHQNIAKSESTIQEELAEKRRKEESERDREVALNFKRIASRRNRLANDGSDSDDFFDSSSEDSDEDVGKARGIKKKTDKKVSMLEALRSRK